MTGLTQDDRTRLESVVRRRLGPRSDPAKLVEAYLSATHRQAFLRTTQDAPLPTTLIVERSVVLLEISRSLGRVVEDYEIQALFRVSETQARSMRRSLLATYSDITDELIVSWALLGALIDGRRKGDQFVGTAVVFESREKRDAFVGEMRRASNKVEIEEGDRRRPWVVLVEDGFSLPKLPKAQGAK